VCGRPWARASGSARLRLGGTDVMVAVKADIGSPAAETPCDGRLQCSVEISASAGTDYEGRLGDSLGGRRAALPDTHSLLSSTIKHVPGVKHGHT